MAPFCGKFVTSCRRPFRNGSSTKVAAAAFHADTSSNPAKLIWQARARKNRRDSGEVETVDRRMRRPPALDRAANTIAPRQCRLCPDAAEAFGGAGNEPNLPCHANHSLRRPDAVEESRTSRRATRVDR